MCHTAGFASIREFRTPIPALTRLLVAEKSIESAPNLHEH
jgi:hypothetical protein